MSEMVSFKKRQFSPLSGKEKSTRKRAYNVKGIRKLQNENIYLSSILFIGNTTYLTPVT